MKGIKFSLNTATPVWIDNGTNNVRFTSDGRLLIVE